MGTKIKYSRCDWLDTKAMAVKYGIKAKASAAFGEPWRYCTEGNKLLIFDTETERDVKLKELRKIERTKKLVKTN